MNTTTMIPSDEELAKIWSDNYRRDAGRQAICAIREAVATPLLARIAELEAALHSSAQYAETYRQCMASSDARVRELEAKVRQHDLVVTANNHNCDAIKALQAERDTLLKKLNEYCEASEWYVRQTSSGDAPEGNLYSTEGILATGMDLLDAEQIATAFGARVSQLTEQIGNLSDANARLQAERDRAVRALTRAGYTDNGGQEWKPPVVPHVKRKPLLVWECSAEQAAQDLHAAECDVTAGFVASAMVYLASRVRVVVPENVPTADQLWTEWMYETKGAETAIHYAHDRLAPYCHQPASVDPALCEESMRLNDVTNQPTLTYEQGYQAAEADMEKLDADSATAETLEQLAKIAEAAHTEFWATSRADFAWQNAVTHTLLAATPVIDVTAEELRAKADELSERTTTIDRDNNDLLRWLTSRIRFTVAPPAECEDIKVSRDYYERQYTLAKNTLNDIRAALAKALE